MVHKTKTPGCLGFKESIGPALLLLFSAETATLGYDKHEHVIAPGYRRLRVLCDTLDNAM